MILSGQQTFGKQGLSQVQSGGRQMLGRLCSRALQHHTPPAPAAAPTSALPRGSHLRAAASAESLRVVDIEAEEVAVPKPLGDGQEPAFQLCCPICMDTEFQLKRMPSKSEGLCCPRCSRTFTSDSKYVDLTLTSGFQPKAYKRKEWGGTELFRAPLISFAYERGWRQGFAWAGFPGEVKEYEMAMEYLKPAYGNVLVDMSCGSGLFSRRFIKSGRFSGVVAADFSESMLEQSRAYIKEDPDTASSLQAAGTSGRSASASQRGASAKSASPVLLLLRADVGRLPFPTGSLAAIHAGAAIHCWPNPQAALAEISRVLRPGGVFVASTFLVPTAPLGQLLGSDDAVRPLTQLQQLTGRQATQMRYWQEDELRDLCDSVGLEGFERQRSWQFIMFAARKPEAAAPRAGQRGGGSREAVRGIQRPDREQQPQEKPVTLQQAVEQAVVLGQAVGQVAEQAVGQAVGQAMEQAVEQAVAAEQAIEQAMEQVQAVQQVVEQAQEQAIAQAVEQVQEVVEVAQAVVLGAQEDQQTELTLQEQAAGQEVAQAVVLQEQQEQQQQVELTPQEQMQAVEREAVVVEEAQGAVVFRFGDTESKEGVEGVKGQLEQEQPQAQAQQHAQQGQKQQQKKQKKGKGQK